MPQIEMDEWDDEAQNRSQFCCLYFFSFFCDLKIAHIDDLADKIVNIYTKVYCILRFSDFA